MLKLTYTDAGLDLERLSGSLESFISQRAVLAVRLSQHFHLEPSGASLLLPRGLRGLAELEIEICREQSQFCPEGMSASVDLYPVDETSYEVSLRGVWITADGDTHEGMFVAAVNDRVEQLLSKLWAIAQSQVFLTG